MRPAGATDKIEGLPWTFRTDVVLADRQFQAQVSQPRRYIRG
jgi:hypothetical protein